MSDRRQRQAQLWFESTDEVVSEALDTFSESGTFDQILRFFAQQSQRIAERAKSREPDRFGLRRDEKIPPHLRTATSVMEAVGGDVRRFVARYYDVIGVDSSTPIEGSITGSIHGETYKLTSFKYDPSSPRPLDRVWVHTHARHVGPVLDHCRDLFQIAMEADMDFETAFGPVATLLWWFYHAHAYVEGSEAIGYWLCHYTMGERTSSPMRFNENPAALAWVCANPDVYKAELRSVVRATPPWSPNVVTDDKQLCYAARRGKTREVKRLLRLIAPNRTEGTGYTALQLAAREGYVNVVKLLLAAGADPTIEHPDSAKQALLMAARCGRLDVVQSLCRAHVDVNAEDRRGSTALHWAVRCRQAKVVKLLLKAGADVNAEDKSLRTSLHYACQNGDRATVKALLSAGRTRPDLNVLDEHQESPLALAATAGHTAIVKLLLKRGGRAPEQDTTLTLLSTGDKKAGGLMRQERMNPGLYRLLLRVAQQGHEETAEVLRQTLLKSLRRQARREAAEVLADLPVRAAIPRENGIDTGKGLTYSLNGDTY